MKKTIYFLAIFAIVLLCTGGKQTNGNNKPQTAVATPVNIKDIFVLLPEDVLPESDFLKPPITVAQRKKLLERIDKEKRTSEIDSKPQIGVCDVKNGYLKLMGLAQSDWEVSFWNLKDSRKRVIVNQGTESGSILKYFLYVNGKLKEDSTYDVLKNITLKVDDFIYLSKLNATTRKAVEKEFAEGKFILYYALPQKGTSIRVWVDTDAMLDYTGADKIPYEATKDLILKWVNEKWER